MQRHSIEQKNRLHRSLLAALDLLDTLGREPDRWEEECLSYALSAMTRDLYLVAELELEAFLKEVMQARGDGRIVELAAFIDKVGNFQRPARRAAANEREVQADAERRVRLRERYSLGERLAIHHQARRGENAFAMRADDRFVDRARTAEVIGVDDQAASCRTT